MVAANKLINRLQRPLLLNSFSIGVYFCPSAHNFTVLELPLVHNSVNKYQFSSAVHLSILHLPFVPHPFSWTSGVGRGIQHTPSVRLIECPLSLVLYSTVGEEQLPLSVHHIVFPSAFVVTPIFEYIFSSSVFQIILFLANILVPIGVLLVHVHKLLLLLHCLLDSSAELAVGHGHHHH